MNSFAYLSLNKSIFITISITMKNNYLKLLGLTFFASGMIASAAPPQRMNMDDISSSLTKRLSQNGRQWRKATTAATPSGMKRVVTGIETNTPPATTWGILNTQDGEEWMYTINYNYYVPADNPYDSTIESAEVTVYDPNFQVVKTFIANFELGENETRINQVELAPTLSKKFFNVDNNYEVMLYVHATTEDYTGHDYTQIYSLGSGEHLTTLEGYNVGVTDNSPDAWSENYIMAFMREDINITDDGDMDYLMHFDIYGKAGYGGGSQLLHTFDVDYELFSGAGNYALPLLMNNHDNKMYYALPRYEKPFFAGPMTEEITPDNNFIIELFDENFQLVKTTTIPMELEDGALFSFPGMGELMGNADLDFDLFSDGIEPMYIIGNENYIPGADEFITSLYVYDTNGNLVNKIVSNCDDYISMTGVKGYNPQWCFYFADETTGGEYHFIDLPSCNVSARIPVILANNVVSNELDRVPVGDGYQYAASLAYGDVDASGNTFHSIAWFNPDGSHNHTDEITLGTDIALAMPYVAGYVLDPYLLNTDENVEYMFLVKEYVDPGISSETKEYLRVYSNNKMILNIGPNEDTGEILRSIFFINAGKKNPKLVIAYYGDEGFTLHSLTLPLSKFAGGEGTIENPYLIATVGDMQTITANPGSAYKLTADIDFNNLPWAGNGCDFTGVFDGNNHTLKNLNLTGAGIFKRIAGTAVVKNLNIENVTISATGDAGVICGWLSGEMSNASRIDNVHIKNIAATGNNVTFGGIAGQASLKPQINNCSITQAYYEFDAGATVGGLVGFIRTSTAISNCVFDGTIIANTAGGIVGGSMSADETISNCHALVNIQGSYAAGGIIGESGRSIVTNCFVDGTVEADAEKTAGAGGIVGVLAAPYTTDKTGLVVQNCIVSANVSATVSGTGERDQAIAHRIIGFTSVDEWLVDWESKDPSFDPSDPSTYPYIKGSSDYNFNNNFALDNAKIDPNVADEISTTEGQSITAEELTDEFLTEHGFNIGTVWMRSLSPLALAGETYNIIAEESQLHLSDANSINGSPALAVFHLDRLYADKVNISLTSNGMAALGETTISPDGYTIECEVYCIGNGSTNLIATLGDKSAVVELSTSSTNAADIQSPASAITYDGFTVKANAEISIYNISGICILHGYNEVSTIGLPKGIYIATDGTESIKIKK